MAKIDADGLQKDMDQDDITTIVVNLAKDLREAADRMERQSSQ